MGGFLAVTTDLRFFVSRDLRQFVCWNTAVSIVSTLSSILSVTEAFIVILDFIAVCCLHNSLSRPLIETFKSCGLYLGRRS